MGDRMFTSVIRSFFSTVWLPRSIRETCSPSAGRAGPPAGRTPLPDSSSSRMVRARRMTRSGTPASLATSMP